MQRTLRPIFLRTDQEEERAREKAPTVSISDLCASLESDGNYYCEHHEYPVDFRDVYLSREFLAGVYNFTCWETTQSHRLLNNGVRCGDHGLACDDGCCCGYYEFGPKNAICNTQSHPVYKRIQLTTDKKMSNIHITYHGASESHPA